MKIAKNLCTAVLHYFRTRVRHHRAYHGFNATSTRYLPLPWFLWRHGAQWWSDERQEAKAQCGRQRSWDSRQSDSHRLARPRHIEPGDSRQQGEAALHHRLRRHVSGHALPGRRVSPQSIHQRLDSIVLGYLSQHRVCREQPHSASAIRQCERAGSGGSIHAQAWVVPVKFRSSDNCASVRDGETTPRWRDCAASPSFWVASTMRAAVDSVCRACE